MKKFSSKAQESLFNRMWRDHEAKYPSVEKTKRNYIPANQRPGWNPKKVQKL